MYSAVIQLIWINNIKSNRDVKYVVNIYARKNLSKVNVYMLVLLYHK